jgi:O-antigen ligase
MVHNVYLEYAADVGLPGLLLFLLLLWSSIRSAAAARRMDKDGSSEGEVSLLAGGIQASLLGFVIAAMVHPVSYNFYFFYLAGLAVAAKRIGIMRAAATEEA